MPPWNTIYYIYVVKLKMYNLYIYTMKNWNSVLNCLFCDLGDDADFIHHTLTV